MPSRDQMIKILDNGEIIGGFQESSGDFSFDDIYWTSSEFEFSPDSKAYGIQWVFLGLASEGMFEEPYSTYKNKPLRVRVVRPF